MARELRKRCVLAAVFFFNLSCRSIEGVDVRVAPVQLDQDWSGSLKALLHTLTKVDHVLVDGQALGDEAKQVLENYVKLFFNLVVQHVCDAALRVGSSAMPSKKVVEMSLLHMLQGSPHMLSALSSSALEALVLRELNRAFHTSVVQSSLLVLGIGHQQAGQGFHPGMETTNRGTFLVHGERSHIAKAFTSFMGPIKDGVVQELVDKLSSPHMVIKKRTVDSYIFDFQRKGVTLNKHEPFCISALPVDANDRAKWMTALSAQMTPGWKKEMDAGSCQHLIAAEVAKRLSIPSGSYALNEFNSPRGALAYLMGYGETKMMDKEEFKAKQAGDPDDPNNLLRYVTEEYWNNKYAQYVTQHSTNVEQVVMKMGKASASFWPLEAAYVFLDNKHAALHYLPSTSGDNDDEKLLDAHYCVDTLTNAKDLDVDEELGEKIRACGLDKTRIRRVLEDHDSKRRECILYEYHTAATVLGRGIVFLVNIPGTDYFEDVVFSPRLAVRVPESVEQFMDAMDLEIEIPADKRYHSFVEEGKGVQLDVVVAVDGTFYVLSNTSGGETPLDNCTHGGQWGAMEAGAQHLIDEVWLEDDDPGMLEDLLSEEEGEQQQQQAPPQYEAGEQQQHGEGEQNFFDLFNDLFDLDLK